MSRTVTIRNVPDDVVNELASRAKGGGSSLQAYILDLLNRETSTPDVRSVLRRVRDEARRDGIEVDNAALLAILDEERPS